MIQKMEKNRGTFIAGIRRNWQQDKKGPA